MITTYDIDEAAKICKCSDDTIRKAIHSLELKASKLGRAWSIKEVDLEKYIDGKSLANIKANKCHSTSAVKSGMSTSRSQGNLASNDLLEQLISAKPKDTKQSLDSNSNK